MSVRLDHCYRSLVGDTMLHSGHFSIFQHVVLHQQNIKCQQNLPWMQNHSHKLQRK